MLQSVLIFKTLTYYQRSDLFIFLFGWYEDPHATHIAMEYIPNGDLGRYIKENKAKAKADGRAITEQILQGLVVLHERGICHCDLKPQVIYHSIVSQRRHWARSC